MVFQMLAPEHVVVLTCRYMLQHVTKALHTERSEILLCGFQAEHASSIFLFML